MSFFDKHVFFCTNLRDDGGDCCGLYDAQKARDYVKQQVRDQFISDHKNKVRINATGCMERCDEGPVLVIYPEATWYTYKNQNDLDEIIEEHLKHGRVVERLKI